METFYVDTPLILQQNESRAMVGGQSEGIFIEDEQIPGSGNAISGEDITLADIWWKASKVGWWDKLTSYLRGATDSLADNIEFFGEHLDRSVKGVIYTPLYYLTILDELSEEYSDVVEGIKTIAKLVTTNVMFYPNGMIMLSPEGAYNSYQLYNDLKLEFYNNPEKTFEIGGYITVEVLLGIFGDKAISKAFKAADVAADAAKIVKIAENSIDVGDMFVDSKKVLDNIEDTANAMDAAFDAYKGVSHADDWLTLSKKNQKHVYAHTAESIQDQLSHLTDEQLLGKLKSDTFFNPDWSKEQVFGAVEEAYNYYNKQGITGLQTYEAYGEQFKIFIKSDGTFDTAYGLHKLTVEFFK